VQFGAKFHELETTGVLLINSASTVLALIVGVASNVVMDDDDIGNVSGNEGGNETGGGGGGGSDGDVEDEDS